MGLNDVIVAALKAYVYPVIVGFVGGGSPPWLYPTSNPHVKGHQIYHSDLGNRQYQDWLANALSQFYDVLGLGGYSFDGVFMGDVRACTHAAVYAYSDVCVRARARVCVCVCFGSLETRRHPHTC